MYIFFYTLRRLVGLLSPPSFLSRKITWALIKAGIGYLIRLLLYNPANETFSKIHGLSVITCTYFLWIKMFFVKMKLCRSVVLYSSPQRIKLRLFKSRPKQRGPLTFFFQIHLYKILTFQLLGYCHYMSHQTILKHELTFNIDKECLQCLETLNE